MIHQTSKATRITFGDFQTPRAFAQKIMRLLREKGIQPASILEPSCGKGSFLLSACEAFPGVPAYGADINPEYIAEVRRELSGQCGHTCQVEVQDFFTHPWEQHIAGLPAPILVVGNPPWVTNATLGTLRSGNLPQKSNFVQHKGLAAKTGKANFDISEFMLLRLLNALQHRKGVVAMLCKTNTATRILQTCWKQNFPRLSHCSLHHFSAQKVFSAAVGAVLFIAHTGEESSAKEVAVYGDISWEHKVARIGWVRGKMVANLEQYEELSHIDGVCEYRWRSGLKHDAAPVMEFHKTPSVNVFVNAMGETVALEDSCLYPLMKSSDLANGKTSPHRFVLVTQHSPSANPASELCDAPLAWNYLLRHAALLDGRKSSIYRKRPRFCQFGIGDYSFAPWKVAVSGLYGNFCFVALGPVGGKPVLLDDTCYSIPCQSREEADFLCGLLNSPLCQDFLRSLTFPDAKRPLSAETLNRIHFQHLAESLQRSWPPPGGGKDFPRQRQLAFF